MSDEGKKKTPKKAAAAKAKAPANHPPYKEMVKRAILDLKERQGSSRAAILKYILKNFNVGDNENKVNASLKLALKSGVKSGGLKQTKGVGASGSFRANKPEAKAKAKKPAAAAAKKPAAAKKSPKKKAAAEPKEEKKVTPKKKPAAKKAAAAKSPAKKAAAKKPAKKAAPKKSPAKKKTPTKKAPAKKGAAKKTAKK